MSWHVDHRRAVNRQPRFVDDQEYAAPVLEHISSRTIPYFIPKKTGTGSASVTVAAGQVVNVTDEPPSWAAFLKRKMTVS